MTLFNALRTFISLCINMSNMVLGHAGDAARHCIVRTFFLCFLLVTGFHPVWSGHCGFLGTKKLACGDQARSICGMHRYGVLREDSKLVWRWRTCYADTWCQAWGACGAQNFNAVCKPNAPPRGIEAKTGGPALGPAKAFSFFCLLWNGCWSCYCCHARRRSRRRLR